MRFEYPTLSTETYNNQRWYLTPHGEFYPSITTVLGFTESEEAKLSLERWRTSLGVEKAAEVSKRATDHGTAVHLLAERYLKGEDVFALIGGEPVSTPDRSAFNALKLKLDRIDEVWGQEVALYSRSLQVCGRTDLAGRYKRIPAIIDFKTAGRIKGHADIGSYKLQLAFYATAHNEMFGTSIETGVILMVAQTGFPMEFIVPIAPEIAELRRRTELFWQQAVNTL